MWTRLTSWLWPTREENPPPDRSVLDRLRVATAHENFRHEAQQPARPGRYESGVADPEGTLTEAKPRC